MAYHSPDDACAIAATGPRWVSFSGIFSYALMVFRRGRARTEGELIPHLLMSVGILPASVCAGTLVFVVGYLVGRINGEAVSQRRRRCFLVGSAGRRC